MQENLELLSDSKLVEIQLSLGDVINPDRQIDLYCDPIAF